MSENNKGLKFYDNLNLTHSHNDEDLQVVYKEWALPMTMTMTIY